MSIKVTERKNALHVTIDGAEYTRLARVARALNQCGWCDSDNTPRSVFLGFGFLDPEQEELTTPGMLEENILGYIGTDTETGGTAPEPLHSKRIAELRAAFEAEGLL